MSNEPRRVRLLSRFEEVGDMDVEVTEDMWAEILPELAHVEVVLDKDDCGEGIIPGRGDDLRAVGGVPPRSREMVAQRTTYPGESTEHRL